MPVYNIRCHLIRSSTSWHERKDRTVILSLQDLMKSLESLQQILNVPEPDTVIWRYYSIEKFLSLITTNQLFFASAPSFQDPFEGDYGELAKQNIKEQYGDGQYLRDYNTYEFLRAHTYMSCWHESEHESDGMWKIYGNGIAITAIPADPVTAQIH